MLLVQTHKAKWVQHLYILRITYSSNGKREVRCSDSFRCKVGNMSPALQNNVKLLLYCRRNQMIHVSERVGLTFPSQRHRDNQISSQHGSKTEHRRSTQLGGGRSQSGRGRLSATSTVRCAVWWCCSRLEV